MKIGDEVYLREDSKLNDLRPSNPINCIGVVDEFYTDYNLKIGVRWSNNEHNAYNEADLILASEADKEEPKGHPNASILMEIAKEAAINPEYWKEFEFEDDHIGWTGAWGEWELFRVIIGTDYQVRRSPRTIRIGNYDVPELFVRLYTEVKGLSFGTDWNKGTHAKHHREAILECVKLIGDVHDDAMKEFMVGNK